MNRNFFGVLLVVLLIVASFVGCAEEVTMQPVKERLVDTKIVESTMMAETIYYFGFIEPGEIKSYALKTSGRVNNVNVKSGDRIEIGDVLVSLDNYEYDLGVKASSEQITLARLELEKAREAKEFYENTYNDTLILFESGVVSSQRLDEIKLQYDIASKEVEQAIKTLNQTKIDYDYKTISLDDTALLSDMNGFVVEVLSKEGELVSQGYPVVIARSEDNVVKIGMSQNDVKKINIGDVAEVIVSGDVYSGTISNINLMPDRLSKTYTVEIDLESGDFLIGESCKVFIELQEIEGIWLNITDVMNDGVDFVFLVKDGRATRRDIELHEINGSLVRVTNIEDGDELIISGKNALSEGYKVKVEGEKDE